MGDPFSIFTGALTVGDLCVKVGKYLRTIAKATGVVDHEIKSLETEIDSFHKVYESLREVFCQSEEQHRLTYKRHGESQEDPSQTLWHQSAELVQEGLSFVTKLETLLDEIVGEQILPGKDEVVADDQLLSKVRSAMSRKYGDLKRSIESTATTKAVKMLSRQNNLESIRQKMTRGNQWLGTMLIAITL